MRGTRWPCSSSTFTSSVTTDVTGTVTTDVTACWAGISTGIGTGNPTIICWRELKIMQTASYKSFVQIANRTLVQTQHLFDFLSWFHNYFSFNSF